MSERAGSARPDCRADAARPKCRADRAAVGVAPALGAALGLILGAAAASSCMSASAPSEPRMDQYKQEIAVLWGQIRQWRQEAGLRGVEPPMVEIVKMHGKSISSARYVCRIEAEARTSTCRDVCSLSDAICDNATSICRIAAELGGDDWADGKCASAKASCKQAKLRCCQCKEREPAPAEPPDEPPAEDAPASNGADTDPGTES